MPTHDADHPREIFVPLAGPPQVERPSPEIYAAMGEANIFRMLSDFYQALGKSSISHLFPEDLELAAQKSAAFFVGLLGGPPLYQQRYGSPALRARHIPFRIDAAARQVWLDCFEAVLAKAPELYSFPAQHLAGFRHWLHEFSRWMVNTK